MINIPIYRIAENIEFVVLIIRITDFPSLPCMCSRTPFGLVMPYGDTDMGHPCSGNGLTAPRHLGNQCWLFIKGVLWHSLKPISQEVLKMSLHKMSLKNNLVKFILTSFRSWWVKSILITDELVTTIQCSYYTIDFLQSTTIHPANEGKINAMFTTFK